MRLYYEWGARQVQKRGEELCGDSMAVSRHRDSVTVALSDGLGSGVKANILATLTTRIATHLLENDLTLDEVVQTLGETLPVCQVRKMAYSTFVIAQFYREGYARIVEFDAPPTLLLRDRKVQPVVYKEREIEQKTFHEAQVFLQFGDWIAFISDGVVNAGIGGRYPLGWGWDQAARFMEEHAHPNLSAQDLADAVAETVGELYAGPPGDDVSVVVIKARHRAVVNVLTGPPHSPDTDARVVEEFVKRGGKLVVCGGMTAKIVSRHVGEPLEVDLSTMTTDVPPLGRMKGLELVTEGILTLTQVNGLLRARVGKDAVKFRTDGASALLRTLLEADTVHFIVGQAVNPAHQNPELPQQLGIRLTVVREIAEELKKLGKEVSLETV